MNHKIGGFSELFATSCRDAHLKSEFWSKLLQIHVPTETTHVACLTSFGSDFLFVALAAGVAIDGIAPCKLTCGLYGGDLLFGEAPMTGQLLPFISPELFD